MQLNLENLRLGISARSASLPMLVSSNYQQCPSNCISCFLAFHQRMPGQGQTQGRIYLQDLQRGKLPSSSFPPPLLFPLPPPPPIPPTHITLPQLKLTTNPECSQATSSETAPPNTPSATQEARNPRRDMYVGPVGARTIISRIARVHRRIRGGGGRGHLLRRLLVSLFSMRVVCVVLCVLTLRVESKQLIRAGSVCLILTSRTPNFSSPSLARTHKCMLAGNTSSYQSAQNVTSPSQRAK